MAGGDGFYRMVGRAPGDQVLRGRQLFSESKSATAAAQDGTDYEIPNMGDVAALVLTLTVNSTGTLTGAKGIDNALKELSIRGSDGKTIWSNVGAAGDLNFLQYLCSEAGRKETIGTTTTGSDVTNTFVIPIAIEESKDLPARIRVTYNPYSSLATSGCTAATVSVVASVFYRDGTTTSTSRLQKLTVSLASGVNDLSSRLPRNVTVAGIGLGIDETYTTSVSVSRDGSEELKMLLAQLQQWLETSRAAAHITDFLYVPVAPFVATDKSQFLVEVSSAISVDLYIFTRG